MVKSKKVTVKKRTRKKADTDEVKEIKLDLLDYKATLSWQRNPSHRWSEALGFLIHHEAPLSLLNGDKYLQRASSYARALYNTKDREHLLRKHFNEVWVAHGIYKQDIPCGIKWVIEALITASMSSADIAAYLTLDGINESVIETYKSIFYDISDLLRSPVGIYTTVLARTKHLSKNVLDEHDYFWKSAALNLGVTGLIDYIIPGAASGKSDRKISDWKKSVVRDGLTIRAMSGASDMRGYFTEETAQSLTVSRNLWDVNPVLEAKMHKGVGDGVADTVKALQNVVQLSLMSSRKKFSSDKEPRLVTRAFVEEKNK